MDINIRYNLIWAPALNPQNGIGMRSPYCSRPHNGEVPDNDKALSVTSHEPFIMANEGSCVDLCFVATQYGFGLSGSGLGGHHYVRSSNGMLSCHYSEGALIRNSETNVNRVNVDHTHDLACHAEKK